MKLLKVVTSRSSLRFSLTVNIQRPHLRTLKT